MKKISTKQAQKNAELARIKAGKPDICLICGNFCVNADLIHLLPRSTFPQYTTEPKNLHKAHRTCHNLYDESKQFRSGFPKIIEIVKNYATIEEINRYFEI